jgi:predicted permease
MQHLQSILSVTFPFFALVLCGYMAVRRGLLPIESIPGLSIFVLYFALSAMLFHFGSATPIGQLLDVPLAVLYTVCSVVLVTVTVVASRNERIGIKDAAFGAMASVFSNSGFMGIPLLLALLGEKAVGIIIVTLFIDQMLISPLCMSIAYVQSNTGQSRSMSALFLSCVRSLRGAALNPLLWSILAGVLFGLSGLSLTEPVRKTIDLLSDAASPVALFTLGAILARNAVKATHRSPLMDYVPVALAKLFVHPLLIFLGACVAEWLGFPLDAQTFTIIVLIAALPSASNVSMLAERFGADSGRIASIIMVSTVLSFFTFSGMVWVLGVSL